MKGMTAKELVAAFREANEGQDKSAYYELLTSQMTTLIAEAKPLLVKSLQLHTNEKIANNISDKQLLKGLTSSIVNGNVKVIAVIIDLAVKLKEIKEGIRNKNGDMIHNNASGSGYDGSGILAGIDSSKIKGGLTNDMNKMGLDSPIQSPYMIGIRPLPNVTPNSVPLDTKSTAKPDTGVVADISTSIKSNKKYWIIGGGVAFIAIAIGIGFYVKYGKKKSA